MHTLEKRYESYTETEIQQIAQLKRIFECTQGDPLIKEPIVKQEPSPEMLQRLKDVGVYLEASDISFLWDIPTETYGYVAALALKLEDKLASDIIEAVHKYPLLMLWGRYVKEQLQFAAACHGCHEKATDNPVFDAWRKRRIAAAKSELGHYGNSISYPILAFELSEGCSVGCWFCSFATYKLKGTLDYATQQGFFSNIIKDCIDLFGKEATGWALPYYRSEPHDNPNYLDYLKEFERLTGAVLCTSTAVGDDLPWTKELIDYYSQRGYGWPRLSILSSTMLHRVHEGFSPMELLEVPLLMQMKDQPRDKVAGGRILEEKEGLRGCEEGANVKEIKVPQGSIACATGFLINLVNRTIELFSPCYTSKKWPYGYRVFDKAAFTDENDFSKVIKEMIQRSMLTSPPTHAPLRFRDDLVYQKTETGFDMVTPNQIHHFKLKNKCGPLGDLIHTGEMTYQEISTLLTTQHGIHPLVLKAAIQSLFDGGFIDEVYHNQKDV